VVMPDDITSVAASGRVRRASMLRVSGRVGGKAGCRITGRLGISGLCSKPWP
jgi:hypothetical protein